ncbi:hypothetical protein GAYE_SCF62G6572 [Galdieria yellowstonensis]|uniref:Rubredoxin-like domain-containing protein n=1 Tax=Galdieria yellowstonensis TaxID=3028027 RepID=A0AAV9IM97_9RHOD|nr:hypothetical protein GAYE_SCF62G6572 [Galdieria yellowstonensis]
MFISWLSVSVAAGSRTRLHRSTLDRKVCRCFCRNRWKHNIQVLMQSSENDSNTPFRVAIAKPRRGRPEKDLKTEQVQPTAEQVENWKPNPLLLAAGTIALASAGGYFGVKKFMKRRKNLIEKCGLELVRYGTAELDLVDIAEEYKNKWELFFSRVDLYEEYLVTLLKERALSFQLLEDTYTVYKTLNLSHSQLLTAFNRAAKRLRERPSALDKLLFVAERLIPEKLRSKLEIMSLFPYPTETVRELQRSLAETCFLQLVRSEGRNKDFSPIEKAELLGLSEDQAQSLYDQYLLEEVQKSDYGKSTTKEKVVSVDERVDSVSTEKDSSSSKPASKAAHAYQCQNCGYTIYPAAGREFKFFGESFVCPQCKSPKSEFVDISSEDDEEADDPEEQ